MESVVGGFPGLYVWCWSQAFRVVHRYTDLDLDMESSLSTTTIASSVLFSEKKQENQKKPPLSFHFASRLELSGVRYPVCVRVFPAFADHVSSNCFRSIDWRPPL